MFKKILLSVALILAVSTVRAIDTGHSNAKLTAAEIAEKNLQARGGLQAWRAVQAISYEGKMGAGGNRRTPLPVSLPETSTEKTLTTERLSEEAQLPFKLLMQRPRKVRYELEFKGRTALQIFDGANGWKLRPYLNRLAVEPFTTDELRIASTQAELDGPLADYLAKGTRIELDGTEKVEDRNTYKLKLTTKDGQATHVWIDAETFLEVKIEGQPRRLDGVEHPVEVYYRDYRTVNGLQIPFVLETKVRPVAANGKNFNDVPPQTEKITIDKVVVNPKLDSMLFSKPEIQAALAKR